MCNECRKRGMPELELVDQEGNYVDYIKMSDLFNGKYELFQKNKWNAKWEKLMITGYTYKEEFMTIIVICIVSFAVSVLSCLITGVALMSLYLKETSKLLESARRNLEIMEQKKWI